MRTHTVSRPESGVPKKRNFLHLLGPGLITGAADDDPSGIGTYSQVGAQFGFGQLWTMLFSFPLMAAIQEISARIGRTTGHGIAANMRRHYPPAVLYGVVGLLLLANTLNLGADLGAMAACVKLLVGGPAALYVVLLGLLTLLLPTFLSYQKFASVLKWLAVALFAYVITVFVVKVPWGKALLATVVPHISWKADYLQGLVAVFGTTISPYLFFWQAGEEAEETEVDPIEKPLKQQPHHARFQLHRIEVDTYTGMGVSNLIAFFIMLAVAATLHTHGKVDIETAAQASAALRPVAGPFAALLFSLGVVGTGLLTVPVLAGSVAYAVCEAFQWPLGFCHTLARAKGFYAVVATVMLLGIGMNFTRINPIKALFWSAVVNGVVSVPVMVILMLMSGNPRIMGRFPPPKAIQALGWAATAVMVAVVIAMFATWGG